MTRVAPFYMINYKYKTLPRSAPAYTGGVFSRLALLPKLALVLLVALLGSVILSVETYVGQLRAAEPNLFCKALAKS